MALASLQTLGYGIPQGTYGSMGPMLNPDGSPRRIPLDANISPDATPGVMAPTGNGVQDALNNPARAASIAGRRSDDAQAGSYTPPAPTSPYGTPPTPNAIYVLPDPDGAGGGFWEPNTGGYNGQATGVTNYNDWIQNQTPGTGSYQASKGPVGDIWNSGIGGKIAITGLAAMGGAALGGYGAAADSAAGAGEAGAGVGAGTSSGAGAGAGAGTVGGIGEGSASTAATGVTPAATAGIGGGDTGLMAGATTGASAPLSAAQDPLGSGGDPGNTAAGSSGRAGSGTAMSRILDGTATTADWLSMGGNLAGTGLGIAGARNQANAYNNLAGQYMAFGAPSRARYEASMTPGFDPNSIPGYSGAVDTASRGLLARLSATGGNPYGNPGGMIEANKQIISGTALPAIQDYQRLNAGTGGYAGFNAAAPGAATAGIGAQGGVYNAIGSGLAGLTNPQPSIYDTLARLGVQGLS